MARLNERTRRTKTLRATWAQAIDPVRSAFSSLAAGSHRVTGRASHIRDAISVRRIFAVYMVALAPLIVFGLYNTGLQIHLALAGEGVEPMANWQTATMGTLGLGGFDAGNFLSCFVHGGLYFLPLLVVVYITARLIELIFAVVRRDDLSPGTWIFALLFVLILPPTTPLWQAAMSGEAVWVPVSQDVPMLIDIVDERGIAGLEGVDWTSAFIGLSPGPIGVSSALFCFVGLGVLLLARLVSFRIVAGFVIGSAIAALLFAAGDPSSNDMFGVPFHWHMVLGGWAFGLAFLVTDPVTAPHTRTGRLIYGLIAGAFVIVVRVLNPAQLDGTAVALLFMSLFAALIDHFVIEANVKRRQARYES